MVITTGCENDMKAEQVAVETMNTELGILPKLVSLPKQPDTVLWEIDEQEGQDNGSLVILLKFSEEDYAYIIGNSNEVDSRANDVMNIDFFRKWVPSTIRESINTVEKGDSYELQDIKQYKPDLFTNTELSPYKNGSVTALGQGYILVSLYTM